MEFNFDEAKETACIGGFGIVGAALGATTQKPLLILAGLIGGLWIGMKVCSWGEEVKTVMTHETEPLNYQQTQSIKNLIIELNPWLKDHEALALIPQIRREYISNPDKYQSA